MPGQLNWSLRSIIRNWVLFFITCSLVNNFLGFVSALQMCWLFLLYANDIQYPHSISQVFATVPFRTPFTWLSNNWNWGAPPPACGKNLALFFKACKTLGQNNYQPTCLVTQQGPACAVCTQFLASGRCCARPRVVIRSQKNRTCALGSAFECTVEVIKCDLGSEFGCR